MLLKGVNPKYKERTKLLNMLRNKGLPLATILQIVQPIKDKTDEEKEMIARELYEKYKDIEF